LERLFAEAKEYLVNRPNAYPQLRKQLIDSCPMGRFGNVDDVANLADFFASDFASFVSGQHLLVNGGATN
jgi:3-oxoacyl-[acyl-carrier protein] reductase